MCHLGSFHILHYILQITPTYEKMRRQMGTAKRQRKHHHASLVKSEKEEVVSVDSSAESDESPKIVKVFVFESINVCIFTDSAETEGKVFG